MHHVFPVIINLMFRSVQFSSVILLDDPGKAPSPKERVFMQILGPISGG